MEQYDLLEGKHHEQELSEEELANVSGGFSLRNLITKEQFGKSAAAVLGASLTDTLIPNPGEKPIWKH